MLLLDIDGTIALPTVGTLPSTWHDAGFTVREVGFDELAIADFILDVLREIPDIYMLSTWGRFAYKLPEAFDFKAEVIDYKDYSQGLTGITGKFEVVKAFGSDVRAWADDHISGMYSEYCEKEGIVAVTPRSDRALTHEEARLLLPSA